MIDIKHENALKVKDWFETRGIEYCTDDDVLVSIYKDISYYGSVVNSTSFTDRVKIMKKQISFIRKNILGLAYDLNKSAKGIKSGYVYAIHNPAWNDYVKIGVAIDVYDRLNSYQTSSPFRDYELIGYVFSDDRLRLEKEIHNKFERNNEWIRTDKSTIKRFLKDHEYFPLDAINRFCVEETIKAIGLCDEVKRKGSEKEKVRWYFKQVKHVLLNISPTYKDVDVDSKDCLMHFCGKWINVGLGLSVVVKDGCVIPLT